MGLLSSIHRICGARQSSIIHPVITMAIVITVAHTARAEQKMIYWAHKGIVYRANLDGTGVEVVYDPTSQNDIIGFIDDDPVTSKIFMYGKNLGTDIPFIRTMDYDGTDVTTILNSGLPPWLYGFDVDPVNRKMYIGTHGAGATQGMRWANLDGTGLAVIPPDPYYPHGIEADPTHGKLYWTDAVQYNGIRRSNLDGTGQENVYNVGADLITQIALDPINDLIYFTNSRLKIIARINMDGSNMTVLLTGIPAEDIELDADNGMLYWGSETMIQRANLDGSGLQNLVTLPYPGHGAGDSIVLVSVPDPVSRGDFNLDHRVDQVDLTLLLSEWGKTSGLHPAWLERFDGHVDQNELTAILSHWGDGITSPMPLDMLAIHNQVPEPATLILIGLGGLLVRTRTRAV